MRQTVIQSLLGLMLFILGSVGAHAQTPLIDDTWISTDKKRITRFQEQENSLIDELEQHNTKARRVLLAWLRHDHAIELFESYQASKDANHMDTALGYAESATELSPDTVRFWKTFGLINLASKRGMIADVQAEGAFRRILELDPEDGEARLMLIRLLLKDADYKSAAEHYAVLFASQPQIVIANDLHQMNLAFISADVAGWGLEIYETYLDQHSLDEGSLFMVSMFETPLDLSSYPQDAKVLVAKSILFKAERHDDQATKLLTLVSSSPQASATVKRTADNLLEYWENEP